QALLKQKGAQPNLVALRTHNNDNWGESSMADTSPQDSFRFWVASAHVVGCSLLLCW
uniref:Uncharacterized protein n=1 Tax=Aegilops tauschii subsp. strangulata TaxID=200361 RepID=A0A453SJA4_AEGTS